MDAPPIHYVRTSDGYDIAYSITGGGPLLVWMPLPFSNLRAQWASNSFGPRLESLSASFTLVQYDGRGEGMSTRGLADIPLIEHYEHDLDAVMTMLGSEHVILCGPTVSAHVAVAYAVKKPERLRALILFQANLDDPLEGVRYLEDLAKESWENFLKIPAYNLYRLDPPERALTILKESMLQEDFFKEMRLAPTSLKPLLPSIRTPTLVIAVHGAYGPRFSGDEEGQRVASLIPGASLVVLQPGTMDYAPVIADFVAGTPERSSTGAAGTAAQSTQVGLSPRELEVLRLIAAGRSNPKIANELVISLNTVQRHVSNILAKTGAANRTEAAVYARDKGLT